ncbi:PRC-barrel domain containing protein [Halobium salinum]|uniref:PRC-barrel domain containing protein n=1 Tax=Halobium salinum TaxID=1364940 RepID=A0ABD5PGM0_9EURY|nr:PRC-barrel domain containing protein [Halobium salinum]
MSHEINFDDDDEGKEVVDANGDTVGRIVSVEHGTAHVDPDPGLTDTIKSKLGWGDADEDTFPLQEAKVAEVSDDQVRLGDL